MIGALPGRPGQVKKQRFLYLRVNSNRKSVSRLVLVHLTQRDLRPIVCDPGVDPDAPDSGLPGLRTWGWRWRAGINRPVWVMMARHVCGGPAYQRTSIILPQAKPNLYRAQFYSSYNHSLFLIHFCFPLMVVSLPLLAFLSGPKVAMTSGE